MDKEGVNNISGRKDGAFGHNKRCIESCLKMLFNTKEVARDEALQSIALLLNNRRNMFRGTGEVNTEKQEATPKIKLSWQDPDIRGNSERAEKKVVALYNKIENDRADYYGKGKVTDPSIGQPLETVDPKRKVEFTKFMAAQMGGAGR